MLASVGYCIENAISKEEWLNGFEEDVSLKRVGKFVRTGWPMKVSSDTKAKLFWSL